jgi:hypothetical protein
LAPELFTRQLRANQNEKGEGGKEGWRTKAGKEGSKDRTTEGQGNGRTGQRKDRATEGQGNGRTGQQKDRATEGQRMKGGRMERSRARETKGSGGITTHCRQKGGGKGREKDIQVRP